MQATHSKRVHAARLCVLATALVMTASGTLPALLLDERALLQRAAHLATGSLHGLVMFGCPFWSGRRPALALSNAALIVAAMIGTNILGVDSGAARSIGIAVLAAVTVVLLRGAHAGFASAKAARSEGGNPSVAGGG